MRSLLTAAAAPFFIIAVVNFAPAEFFSCTEIVSKNKGESPGGPLPEKIDTGCIEIAEFFFFKCIKYIGAIQPQPGFVLNDLSRKPGIHVKRRWYPVVIVNIGTAVFCGYVHVCHVFYHDGMICFCGK